MEYFRPLVAALIILGLVIFWLVRFLRYPLFPIFPAVAATAAYAWCAYWVLLESQSVAGIILAYALTNAAVTYIYPVLCRIGIKATQRQRDTIARLALTGGIRHAFVLYLRPFDITDKLSLTGLSAWWGGLEIEALVHDSCRGIGKLVALGRPGESVGAGKMRTNEQDWQSRFCALAERSSCIVVIPASNDGTFFEVSWIVQNSALSKTVFMMLPQTRRRVHLFDFGFNDPLYQEYSKRWEDFRNRAVELGLKFPAYVRNGALLRFDANGALLEQSIFGWGTASIKWTLHRQLRIVHKTARELDPERVL